MKQLSENKRYKYDIRIITVLVSDKTTIIL